MSIALARKYRPRDFASVAVQSHVSDTLKGAIARGRVAHGYLLCGPRGTGKTTLARVLAMALNCEHRTERTDGEPCGECVSCERIWSGGASLDVVEIDAASNRGVDDARDLRERAMYAPTSDDRYKVYIVDEAHMLTREAWNALLKVLEEPPPRVVFVFATTDPQKIAQTAAPVLSRLQRFDLKRIGPPEIRDRLAHVLGAEGVEWEPEALAMIARAADGGLRDALSLVDQVLSLGDAALVTADRVRDALGLVAEDEYLQLLDLLAERRAGDVFAMVGRLADAGVDFTTFLGGFTDVLRAQLAVALGGSPPDVSATLRVALEARAATFPVADLLRMLQAVGELEPRFRKSGQQRLLLELLFVRFALLDRSVDLEQVLRALGGGGGDGDRPARTAAATPPPVRPAPGPVAPPSGASDSSAPPAAASTPGEVDVSRGKARARTSTDRGRPDRVAGGAEEEPPAWDGPPPWSDGFDDAPPVARAPDRGRSGVSAAVAPGVATPPVGGAIPDLHVVVGRWDAVVGRVRATGRSIVATILAEVEPVSVNADGVLLLRLPHEGADSALSGAMADVLAAVQAELPSIRTIGLRRPTGSAAPVARLTTATVIAERLAVLKKRDPALEAAIAELDLELLD